MTEDPAVIAGFRQRIARGARRAAQLQFSLATTRTRSLAASRLDFSRLGVNTKNLDQAIGAANAELRKRTRCSPRAISTRRTNSRLHAAQHSCRSDRATTRRRGRRSARVQQRPVRNVARHARCRKPSSRQSLASLRGGENQLIGGDFEDLGPAAASRLAAHRRSAGRHPNERRSFRVADRTRDATAWNSPPQAAPGGTRTADRRSAAGLDHFAADSRDGGRSARDLRLGPRAAADRRQHRRARNRRFARRPGTRAPRPQHHRLAAVSHDPRHRATRPT